MEALESESQLSLSYAVELLQKIPLAEEHLPPLIDLVERGQQPWRYRTAFLQIIRKVKPDLEPALK